MARNLITEVVFPISSEQVSQKAHRSKKKKKMEDAYIGVLGNWACRESAKMTMETQIRFLKPSCRDP